MINDEAIKALPVSFSFPPFSSSFLFGVECTLVRWLESNTAVSYIPGYSTRDGPFNVSLRKTIRYKWKDIPNVGSNVQRRPLISIDRVSLKPRQLRNASDLRLFSFLAITHIPMKTRWIGPHHLKSAVATATGLFIREIFQQPVADAGRHDEDVALLGQHLHLARVVLAAEAEPRPPADDAQHLVGRGVEVGRGVHGEAPLGLHDPD